ncbi:MAG: radical SAM protein [Desulfobacterota bacterium]|nr:radical SAM protein [Thermodesulfobacteriota bacterium]
MRDNIGMGFTRLRRVYARPREGINPSPTIAGSSAPIKSKAYPERSLLMAEQGNAYIVRLSSQRAPLWESKKPLLLELDLELTERCNNNCLHCSINLPADDRGAQKRERSTEAVELALKEAASLGCLTVRFTGGEPLLRRDFEELYLYARRLGLKVLLFTNATLITPSLAELFSRIPPLEKIEVTVYGMKRTSYEAATRTPGSFEAAWRGINLLLEKKVPFVVKGALLPPNKDEVKAFENWASTLPWMEGPPSYAMFFDLRCRRDEKKSVSIRKIRTAPEEGVRFLARRNQERLKEMKAFCSRFIGPPGDDLFSCGAGVNGGCLDAYGRFQLCMDLRHPDTVYDLTRGSLNEAMKRFFPQVRAMKAKHPGYLARCARCFLKGLCEQCPGKSWMEHGTLDTPVEYLCDIAHAEARQIGLLDAREKGWEVKDWRERIRNMSEGIESERRIAYGD